VQAFPALVARLSANYTAILGRLRRAAPDAEIITVGFYNHLPSSTQRPTLWWKPSINLPSKLQQRIVRASPTPLYRLIWQVHSPRHGVL
jgi:hypothetical protein